MFTAAEYDMYESVITIVFQRMLKSKTIETVERPMVAWDWVGMGRGRDAQSTERFCCCETALYDSIGVGAVV